MSSPRSLNLTDYTKDVQANIDPKYEIIDTLGEGENSIAFAVLDKEYGDTKCLKTISPKIITSADRRAAGTKLEQEVRILRKLSHRCIPHIYFEDFLHDLPYYVCTYHPGDTWHKISSGESKLNVTLRLDHIYFIIASIFDTFEYLHGQNVAHGDFHAKNILIGENIYRHGILVIDFGSSKDNGGSEHRRADMASIGRTLKIFKEKFFENSSYEQYMLFVEFCDLLIANPGMDWKSASHRLEFVIDPQYLRTKTEFLFSKRDGSRGFAVIPSSAPIPVGHAVQEVIDTDIFQRLRSIRQLSFCEWEYAGATHSRFEHSLGVYGATKQALDFLGQDRVFRDHYDARDVAATLAAALLHDVGHYPFAHVLEHYISNRFQGPENREVRHGVQHLNFSKELILQNTKIKEALRMWGRDIEVDVVQILNNERGVLSDLLDGPVDCDKIDYLKRDSHHCGVPYGAGFDRGEIIGGFKCSPSGMSIVFALSAVPAIEGFMIAQDQMLSNVYWHSTVRAIFSMFHRFIDATCGKDFGKIVALVRQLRACSGEYDAVERVFAPMAKGRENLLKFIDLHKAPRSTNIFQSIATFRITDAMPSGFRGRNVFRTIVNSGDPSSMTGPPVDWPEVQHLRNSFKKAIEEKGSKVSIVDILIDIPWGKNAPRMVNIVEPGIFAEPVSITKRSHLAGTIFTNHTAFSAPIRVFVPPKVAEAIRSKLDSVWHSAMEVFYSKHDTLSDEQPSELV